MKKTLILFITIFLLFTACSAPVIKSNDVKPTQETKKMITDEPSSVTPEPTESTTEPAPEPIPDKIAVVVARDGYASSEFNPVIDALKDAGYIPVILSDKMGQADGGKEKVNIEHIFNDINGIEFGGIVLIGGSDALWENKDLHKLINEIHDLDRVTSAICLASVTLAKAGVIGEGDEACWFNSDISDPEMVAAGVKDSGNLVTVNGKVITGNGPPAADEFAKAIVMALNE